MADKQKVLICGDVNGKFKTLFSRVSSINKKNGPFDFLLCVGNFFGSSEEDWEPYKNGKIAVPVPTYILGPNNAAHTQYYPDINGCELAPNISYLGKRGVFNSSTGLRMAYLSGVDGKEPVDCSFNAADVTRVRDLCVKGQPSYVGIDILLTSTWPHGIGQLDTKLVGNAPSGSPLLSWLAVQIKPRYHFCGLDSVYYEPPPYKNLDIGNGIHCTRFMALAPVDNPYKQKWLYALNLTPMDMMRKAELLQQTTDQMNLPYTGFALSSNCGSSTSDNPTQFFYDMTPAKRKQDGNGHHDRKKQKPTFDQSKCWFCLANRNVDKHMVISIGTEVYLALIKGGLVPQHAMISTITHYQSITQVPDSFLLEIDQFKKALTKCFAKDDKVPVFFERNYKTSHLQIQVVPVPLKLSDKLKEIFHDFAEEASITLSELPEHAQFNQIVSSGTPYFCVDLPSNERLFYKVKKYFPLQFGREVLASRRVLDMEERGDYKLCYLTKEEETEFAQQFRKMFEPFDFTL